MFHCVYAKFKHLRLTQLCKFTICNNMNINLVILSTINTNVFYKIALLIYKAVMCRNYAIHQIVINDT